MELAGKILNSDNKLFHLFLRSPLPPDLAKEELSSTRGGKSSREKCRKRGFNFGVLLRT
jgi:hypothetical protein